MKTLFVIRITIQLIVIWLVGANQMYNKCFIYFEPEKSETNMSLREVKIASVLFPLIYFLPPIYCE